MKFLIILAFTAVAIATPNGQITAINERIISGSPAAVGQFPWQVGIHYDTSEGGFFCGGSILNANWVLTAAHCVKGAFMFQLQFGGITNNGKEEGRVDVLALESIAHPKYNFLYHNDIALIKLLNPIEFNDRIRPIKLPKRGSQIGSGEVVTASGWGKTSDEATTVSDTLNFVELSTITNSECKKTFPLFNIISSTLCCKGRLEENTCSGDSGGPLVTYDANGEATQVGVVSFGYKPGCALGRPSAYARTESFLDWIHGNTGIPV